MASHELKKSHASGGTYVDTETVITYEDGATSVDVVINQLPGLAYWGRPQSETVRKWVDELLNGKGVKRAGARIENRPWGNAWRFTYFVEAK